MIAINGSSTVCSRCISPAQRLGDVFDVEVAARAPVRVPKNRHASIGLGGG